MRLSRVLLLAVLAPSMAYGWGFDGHRRLVRHMHEPLPSGHCLRAFIQANQTFAFQDMSADPDRWRQSSHPGYDPNEWPRHYLEIDWETPIERYPREWSSVQARFGQYADRNGRVPWRVEEYYAKLVEAFLSGDAATVLATLAHFSHYVTDAFSVLHDTKNFDPNGLHARWESDMLQVRSNIDGIAALSATYLGTLGRAHPRHATFDIVIVGNGLVPQLVAADQAAHDGGTFDMPKFYESVKDLTARRWGDALTLLASLVASAWLDAGKPMLPGMPAGCSTDVPQGEVVLKGFPVPGGWYQPPPDAGGAGGGGGGGFGGLDAGAQPPPNAPGETPPASCGGCGGAAFLVWPALLAFARLRRRAVGPPKPVAPASSFRVAAHRVPASPGSNATAEAPPR